MATKRTTDICVLVSGGLDSAALLGTLAGKHRRVFPLFVRMGLQWEKTELYWLRRFLAQLDSPRVQPLTVVELPATDVYGKHWSVTGKHVPGARTPDEAVYLPGRNLLLVSKAAVFCALRDIPTIALAPLGRNPFPDATPAFFRKFAQVASRALGRRITVAAPFRKLTKPQLIVRSPELPLHLTFSCIAPRGRLHCGRCNKCAERKIAFREAKVRDFTRYSA